MILDYFPSNDFFNEVQRRGVFSKREKEREAKRIEFRGTIRTTVPPPHKLSDQPAKSRPRIEASIFVEIAVGYY